MCARRLQVKVLWVLNAKQSTWEQQLPAEVSQLLAATRKEAPAGTANVTAAAVRGKRCLLGSDLCDELTAAHTPLLEPLASCLPQCHCTVQALLAAKQAACSEQVMGHSSCGLLLEALSFGLDWCALC